LTEHTNGIPRWRDLDERDQRLRAEHKGDIVHLDKRMRALESVIDQQRGARSLVVFLIGSNLVLVLALSVQILLP